MSRAGLAALWLAAAQKVMADTVEAAKPSLPKPETKKDA